MFTTLRRLFRSKSVTASAQPAGVKRVRLEALENRALLAANPFVTIDAVGITQPTSGPITDGGPLQITAYNVQSTKAGIGAVTFFRDRNGNNIVDRGDQVIGQGGRLAGTSDFVLNISKINLSRLPIGQNTVLVRAVDSKGNFSTHAPAESQRLSVTVQAGPGIASLNVRSTLPTTLDTKFNITAQNVRPSTGTATITGVNFYLDVNRDGIIDGGDTLLGAGTKSKSNWVLSNVTLPQGTSLTQSQQFLARATDSLNRVSGTATAVMGPSMIGLRVRPTQTLGANQEFRLVAAGLRTAGSSLKNVNFYLDSNNNGVIDENDELLGTRTSSRDGAATLTLNTANLSAGGSVRFLASMTNRTDQVSLTYVATATLPSIET